MGPIFVHTQRNTNNFAAFFSSLQRMDNELKDIQAIGTDGDEALMNAVTICFQDARCLGGYTALHHIDIDGFLNTLLV
jgi:hypothetical protein